MLRSAYHDLKKYSAIYTMKSGKEGVAPLVEEAKKYSPVYFLMGEESYYIDKISEYIEKNVLVNLSVFNGPPGLTLVSKLHSKVNLISALHAKKIAESVLLSVFRIAFSASLFMDDISMDHHIESL